MASIHRRLSEEGDCPCADGWVKFKGEWVQPTDEEAAEAGYVKSDTADNACGCVTWVKKEGERRKLFDGDVCEDAADELVAKITEEALGRDLSSCAALKDIVGGCEHEMAKMHCPSLRAVRRVARRAGEAPRSTSAPSERARTASLKDSARARDEHAARTEVRMSP